MSKSLQAIRGMNDILPEQTPLWRYFEGTVARLLDNYGYKQIRMPIVEFTELFKRSIGEVTDIVEKEMYSFTDSLNGEPLKVHAAQLGDGHGQPGSILAADKNGLSVACGSGALRLTRLQLPGGKPLNFTDLYNSRRELFAIGQVLGA